jgi:hypothetical protein
LKGKESIFHLGKLNSALHRNKFSVPLPVFDGKIMANDAGLTVMPAHII